ncbi:hypothetical protein [Methylorubrum salsuginis]|nr:hypothetical protein [Methylorubrum salsuginis]
MGDLRLKTKGLNNAGFRKLQQTLMAAVPRQDRHQGRLPPKVMDEISAKCLLNHALIDWENLEDENGQPIPYSKDQARAFLTDPAYRPFFDACVYAATVVGEEQAAADEADEGNSQTA